MNSNIKIDEQKGRSGSGFRDYLLDVSRMVEVTGFKRPKSGYGMLALCRHKGQEQRLDISSPEWIEPLPQGFEWIAAYQAWRKRTNRRAEFA